MSSFLSVNRWKQAVQVNPNDSYAWFFLGMSYLDSGTIGDAYKALEKAIRLDPYNAFAHFVLGIVYALGGEYKFSMKEWEKAVTVDPNVYNKLLARPEIRGVIEKHMDEALRRYKREIDYNPQNIEAYLNMGKAMLFLGKYEASLQYLRRVTEIKPDFWEAYMYLGMAYNKMGQYQLAIANLKRAITVNPKFAEGYHALGELYISLGNPALAMRAFEKAVELDPSNARYLTSLGKALQLVGNNLAAIRAFQRAIDLNPRSKWPHFYLAQALEQEYQFDLAFEEYKKALELDPHFDEVYAHIGKLAKAMGMYQEAIEYLKKAAEVNKMDYEILYELATTYQAMGMIDEALRTLEELLKINPQLFYAWLSYGNLLLQRGDIERAKEAFSKLIELNPKFNDAYITLGKIYMEEGDHERALELFQRAYNNNPSLREALWHMIEAHIALKRFRDALDTLNLYIDKFGETREALIQKAKLYDLMDNLEGKIEVYQKLLSEYKLDDEDVLREAIKLFLKVPSHHQKAYELARRLADKTGERDDMMLLIEASRLVDKLDEVKDKIEALGRELLKQLEEVEDEAERYELLKDKLWLLEELGKIYAQEGKLREAADVYRKLVEITGAPEHQLTLAKLYIQMDQLTEALQLAKTAMSDERLKREAIKLLTKLYHKLELYHEVIKYAKDYITSYNLDDEVGSMLVEALLAEGERDEAKEYLELLVETPSPKALLLYSLFQENKEKFRTYISRAVNLAKKLLEKSELTEEYYEEVLTKAVTLLSERAQVDLIEAIGEGLIERAPSKLNIFLRAVEEVERNGSLEDALRVSKWAEEKAKQLKELELYERFREKSERLSAEIKKIESLKGWLSSLDSRLLDIYEMLERGELSSAESFLESLSRDEALRDTPQLLFLLGSLKLSQREYEEAAYHFLKGMDEALNRADVFAHSLLSSKANELSDRVDLTEVKSRIETEKKRMEMLMEIEEQAQEEVEVSSGLKRSIRSLEKLAEKVLEELDEEPGTSDALDDLFIRAVNAYEAFEYEFTESYLKEYLMKKPEDKVAQRYLARTYYQLESYDAAAKLYSNLNPEDMEETDQFYFVDSLLRLGRYEDVMNFIDKLNGKSQIAEQLKAIAYAHMKRFKDAISIVRKLLKKAPQDWMNLYALALISIKLKKYKEATKHIKLAQKYSPANFKLLEELINLLLLQKRHDEAITTCVKALSYIKPSYKARGLLIRTLIRVGEFDRALKEWKSLEGDEGVPKSYKLNLKPLIDKITATEEES